MNSPARSTTAERLVTSVENLRRSQPEHAWRVMRRGFAAAARQTDDAGRGELWRLRGHVLRSLRRARAAVDAYRRAETWFDRAGEAREAGRCAIGLVDALMYLGRYHEAFRVAARGRRLLTRVRDHASIARLSNNEGNIFHRLDLPNRALTCYRDARRSLRRAGDPRSVAMVEGNIANCLSLLGRCAEARSLYLGVRQAHEKAGFELDALNAEYNLGYLDFLEHHYEAALEQLSHVSDEAGRRGYPSFVALAALDRSEILLRMGAHGHALAEARCAIQKCVDLGLSYERAKAETFAALAEHRLGQRASAVARLERSLAMFHAEGNDVWTGEALVGLATAWLRDGNPRAAAALLASARRRFMRAGDREREACCLALLSCAQLECGEQLGAAASLAESQRVQRQPSPRLRHLTLAAEAALARARGDVARARGRLRRAAVEAERFAACVLDEQWRSSFWGEWGWPHLELAALELSQGRVGSALEVLERGRGRALVGLFGRARSANLATLPKLAREWAASQQARERRRLSRSDDTFAAPHPGIARPSLSGNVPRTLLRLPATGIRAGTLQRSLAEGQLLVDYFLHDGTLGAIALSRDGLAGRAKLIREQELGKLVQLLLFDLRGVAFAPVHERAPGSDSNDALAELAARVLWPVLREFPADHSPQSLAVVPVGPLARLPWAALPLPDGRSLCEAMEVLVVPGLRLSTVGPAASARRTPGEHRFDAPVVIAADTGDLENVERETRAVVDRFPGARLLVGAEATAGRFLELAPRAPWIHFAGHGHFRAEAPHESALRFADRWLLAAELAELRLAASWVGLSACQTARALVSPGEEWFGLVRSFLLSGAGRVLASHWDVGDEATAALMADLYRRLADGHTLGGALSGAQAARMRQGAHPLEWAGFVVLGGPDVASNRDGRRPFGASNRSRASGIINAHPEVAP